MRIHFRAFESVLIDQLKTPNRQNDVLGGALDDALAERIKTALRNDPKTTQAKLAALLDIPRRTLQRKMDELRAEGAIERVGGKRYGHWDVH